MRNQLLFIAVVLMVSLIACGDAPAQKPKSSQQYIDDAATRARISRCEIWVGMTKAQLIESWGQPERTNRTSTSGRELSQLVYEERAAKRRDERCSETIVGGDGKPVKIRTGEPLPKHAYVHVEKDLVVSIQSVQ